MKKRYIILFTLLLFAGWIYYSGNAIPNVPPLKDGDLVFQTAITSQSGAIVVVTASPYTHVGMIRRDGDKIMVIEAADQVIEREWTQWVDSGLFNRVSIYRYPELTQEQAELVIRAARTRLGMPYDIFFSFDNQEMYCSEIPYLAYREAGVSIGKVEKLGELNLDNPLAEELIRQRWQLLPACRDNGYDFEQCYQHILNQELISPAALAADPQLQEIYSNYLF